VFDPYVSPVVNILFGNGSQQDLWIYILRHLVIEQDALVPPYSKSIELLDARQIKAIAIRAAACSTSRAWDSGELAPRSFVRMDLPRSVTWFGLLSV